MGRAKNLYRKYLKLDIQVNLILNELIDKNLGKICIECISDCCDYKTFIDDLTGENIDFRFFGIDMDGNILGLRDDDTLFDIGTLKLNNILLPSKISIIKELEEL